MARLKLLLRLARLHFLVFGFMIYLMGYLLALSNGASFDMGKFVSARAVLVPNKIMNIVQTAQYYGFSTLITAIQAANLVSTLEGTGPFTVFAPTNAAFAALPAGTLDSLLADKSSLTAVLTYHVVPGYLLASDVVAKTSLTTVQGQMLTISTAGGAKVNGANIIQTDIECTNGVIHAIDTVLLPK